ncbi:MAG: CapA family protein [Actinomycetota bacterium]|nr:CapA family protein [Actinomycetota bacterium]
MSQPLAPITIMAVGDLVLDEPNPSFFFAPSADVLRSADLAIGQIEVPHTTSTETASLDVPAPPADPANLAAAAEAGITVGTLAGNHIYDCGPQGVTDTVRFCREAGIEPTGAGADLDEARRPVIVERGGHRIGVVSYNCVGPRESWATSSKAGAAYVHALTHYELDSANPGGPPSIYSFAAPKSLAAFEADVRALAAEVDVPIVALHKGIGHMPAEIAAYEYQVAHAAIDAGAKAVIAHHAHILRGVEIYRGRPIFHGLGNFVTVTRALTLEGPNTPEREAWARRRKKLFGVVPDPDMPTYPFHPESRNTMIATIEVDADGEVTAGLIPVWIDDEARPVPLGDSAEGRSVVEYIEGISREAELDTVYTWRDGRVTITAGASA